MKNGSVMNQQFFVGRDSSREVPLGWDWAVARIELLFTPKPKASVLLAQAQQVLGLKDSYIDFSAEDLYLKLRNYRTRFRLGRETDEDLLHAMALVCETAYRIRAERPYLPQVACALGIFKSCIMEMATGEGKTLSTALAAVIEGWRGKGCHVITSNDYLATRDAKEMKQFFTACLLSSRSITQDSSPEERQEAYAADITYLTSKDVVADFLRDQMALGKMSTYERMLARSLCNYEMPMTVQRGLHCAIVDEADSVLCDGGSTPLIISVPKDNAPSPEQYITASSLAGNMALGTDYRVNYEFREAQLTDSGRLKVLKTVQDVAEPWAKRTRAVELVLQAVEAREFFKNSVHYVMMDEKVVIVDEATGRIMPDHEWRDGLHQAVSAKEAVEVIPPRATSAQSSFQDFFLRYKHLGGMTGTAREAKKEFLQFYRLPVIPIPTNVPCRRVISKRVCCTTFEEKIRVIVEDVRQEYSKGRAVLVGTKSIETSEDISKALSEVGIGHEVLNAVHQEREAEIVQLAGQHKAVTVATNMAGRGTDIKLQSSVKESGGLHVILTELHSSARIDRQLHGRAGRQGDPGSVAEVICLEDELIKKSSPPIRYYLKFFCTTPVFRSASHYFFWKLAGFAQWLENARGFRMRKSMIKNNDYFSEMISYSGKQR